MERFINYFGNDVWLDESEYTCHDFLEGLEYGTKPIPYSVYAAMLDYKKVYPTLFDPEIRAADNIDVLLYYADELTVYARPIARIVRRYNTVFGFGHAKGLARRFRRRWVYDKELKQHSWIWRLFYCLFRDKF